MLFAGNDLLEIKRIERSMKNPRFLRRVLGSAEYAYLEGRGFPVQSVAASFSAKEAFSKAVGTGISGFLLTEVELLREPNGRPYLCLSGRAKELADGLNAQFAVTVSHTREYVSVVVVGTDGEAEIKR